MRRRYSEEVLAAKEAVKTLFCGAAAGNLTQALRMAKEQGHVLSYMSAFNFMKREKWAFQPAEKKPE